MLPLLVHTILILFLSARGPYLSWNDVLCCRHPGLNLCSTWCLFRQVSDLPLRVRLVPHPFLLRYPHSYGGRDRDVSLAGKCNVANMPEYPLVRATPYRGGFSGSDRVISMYVILLFFNYLSGYLCTSMAAPPPHG